MNSSAKARLAIVNVRLVQTNFASDNDVGVRAMVFVVLELTPSLEFCGGDKWIALASEILLVGSEYSVWIVLVVDGLRHDCSMVDGCGGV